MSTEEDDKQYTLSRDGERYYGRYATVQEALNEANSDRCWIGIATPPPSPETMWHAEDWLEHVSVQDSYCGEWAEDWDESTKSQRDELEDEVRRVMAAWLDRHGLRPKFWTVTDSVEYVLDKSNEYRPVNQPQHAP